MNLYIAGLVRGKNYPLNKKLDLDGCKDMIVVDREYFLRKMTLIQAWALNPGNSTVINDADGVSITS